MLSLNRAQLIGNLTRDPELRSTSGGQSVVNFSVATNRSYLDANKVRQEQTDFHNIVAWGKLAEICAQFLAKGRKVFVEGRLQTRDWEGQDGSKRRSTEIVAENVIILDKGPRTGAPAGGFGQAASTPFGEGSIQTAAPVSAPVEEVRVEDIPF